MLKEKATRAIGWSTVDQIIRQGLFFAVSVTMARLVAPEAYGTVVLLNLFTGIAGIFVDVGLSSALIQKKETTLADESTVFWFNVAVGLLMGVALFLSAPFISGFYGIPVLTPIARLYSFLFIFGAGNAVHSALFVKHLDFKTPLKVTSGSLLVSSVVGILLAWKGYGVWALVAQTLMAGILETVLLWFFSSWRPAVIFRLESFKLLFRFGGFLFLAGLLDTGYQNLYSLVIGKWYGVHDLGIYNRANATKQLPTGVLSGILSRVAFPIFSQVADDPERLRRGLRQSIRGIMFLNIPMMLGIAVVAEPLILTLFGQVWAPAIPLLQVLALGAVLFPLQVLNLNVLNAMGHSSKFLKIEIVKKVVGISLIVLGARFGILGMAWAVVVSSVTSFLFNSYYTGKILKYGPYKQVLDCLPALSCAVLMGILVLACDGIVTGTPLLRLIVLSFGGFGAFILTASLLKLAEFSDGVHFIRSYMKSR
jgi:teichuronic acid exporter